MFSVVVVVVGPRRSIVSGRGSVYRGAHVGRAGFFPFFGERAIKAVVDVAVGRRTSFC